MAHKQVWVKVNAQVDERIAGLISEMNEVPGMQTVESCQGGVIEGRDDKACAFIYFYFGNWRKICRLAFDEMAPALSGLGHVQV